MSDRMFSDCCYGTEAQHVASKPCPQAMRDAAPELYAALVDAVRAASDSHVEKAWVDALAKARGEK